MYPWRLKPSVAGCLAVAAPRWERKGTDCPRRQHSSRPKLRLLTVRPQIFLSSELMKGSFRASRPHAILVQGAGKCRASLGADLWAVFTVIYSWGKEGPLPSSSSSKMFLFVCALYVCVCTLCVHSICVCTVCALYMCVLYACMHFMCACMRLCTMCPQHQLRPEK